MSQYDYNKTVDVVRLKHEIRASAIDKALDRIEAIGSTVSIIFKADLSGAEETILNDIITNHVNEPLPSQEIQMVEIYQGPSGTGGSYRVQGRRFDIPAKASLDDNDTDEEIFDWSLPYPVRIFTASWVEKPEHEAAIVNLEIAPDTPVAQLTGPTVGGEPWIDVPAASLPHIHIGYHLTLWDGVSTKEYLGNVIEVDSINNKVKVEIAPAGVWPVSAVVLMTVVMGDNLVLNGVAVPRKIGGGKVGGSFVPANTPIRLRYRRGIPNAEAIYLSLQFELDY